ncbi:unnamed protein product, partial [Ectocarpus sp. 4 AP-2014]
MKLQFEHHSSSVKHHTVLLWFVLSHDKAYKKLKTRLREKTTTASLGRCQQRKVVPALKAAAPPLAVDNGSAAAPPPGTGCALRTTQHLPLGGIAVRRILLSIVVLFVATLVQ